MAKIHPQALLSSSTPPSYFTSKQETFTIWMKSLLLSGTGCTVYDSNGAVVYRVDNYNCKCGNEVFLMDLEGNVLFTILRKKLKMFSCWEGYRSGGDAEKVKQSKPGFQVRKNLSLVKAGLACRVSVGLDKNQPSAEYTIETCIRNGKPTCRIVDKSGLHIAEVTRKQSTGGIIFGEDVLTMVVEPSMDHSLIMGMLIVYNLINYKL
ncbi:protein LURP-one-related 11-like [Mercurialis annua]|uniref:protein LURP-one-related 11-like n=1 Tax=Mercurialis annua TaxID=3986 RepID=UPI00215DF03C|nr:protein LURP-one-related 11-like [Mercurialis annua]